MTESKRRNLGEFFGDIFYTFNKMSASEIKGWQTIVVMAIVADMIGVWWFLGAKRLGMALLVVLLIFIGILAFASRNKEPESVESVKSSKKVTPSSSESSSNDFFGSLSSSVSNYDPFGSSNVKKPSTFFS